MAVAATGKAEPRGPQQSEWNWEDQNPFPRVPGNASPSGGSWWQDATSLGLQGGGGLQQRCGSLAGRLTRNLTPCQGRDGIPGAVHEVFCVAEPLAGCQAAFQIWLSLPGRFNTSWLLCSLHGCSPPFRQLLAHLGTAAAANLAPLLCQARCRIISSSAWRQRKGAEVEKEETTFHTGDGAGAGQS